MNDILSNLCMQSYTVVNQITEGCSGDDKYKLKKNGDSFLLRIGEVKEANERGKEFERLKMYVQQDIHTHRPICFGTTKSKFFSIMSWVEGTNIMDIIKKDAGKDYYELGVRVGKELKKLHLASKSASKADWRNIVQGKAELVLKNYESMNILFANSEQAKKYIYDYLNTLPKYADVMLHGDFHWNNIVVDSNGEVGIIDFSGTHVGDPWSEFSGALWALEYSESFVNGQIDGYFDTPPMEFWRAFKLYTALYAFEHLMYNDKTNEDIQSKIVNAERMLSIYGKDFNLEIPVFRKQRV